MENYRVVLIKCPYTGRYYIYTQTMIDGKIYINTERIG